MKVRITILCENSVGNPFGVIGEHGFACYVETEKSSYLFDTGQGMGIIPNSLALKKDLKKAEAIMISHGHYDHTGGLPQVLALKGGADVYGHPDMFTERIFEFSGITRDIGIPFRKGYLESLGARFHLGTEMVQVGRRVWLTGEIPRKTDFEKGDANMTACLPDGSTIKPDPIKDDLSMVVESEKGLILVLGCAHAGLVNILNYVIDKMGKDRIYAIIGGTHLGFSSDEQFEKTIEAIDKYKIEKMGVSHCTGLMKASLLHARLGEKFFFGSVGSVLEA